ncbi:MAG: HEAT repeat domain-containing protein, partial [Deferribacteres bacterium]|nr:HEAT repeat domain-containing protein [Deferribacteres bacterium]
MVDTRDSLPIDTRLLSEAVIELNITRHNVSIYPANHPIVEKSLNKAFRLLQKLFELRNEIALAVAKDTLIIDNYALDKQNPVYREFAISLSSKSIASVTFVNGLTKEELCSFQDFISVNIKNSSPQDVQDLLREYSLPHIRITFIDYSVFTLVEGTKERGDREVSLWEQYIYGLLEGRLQSEDTPDVIQGIPPEKLAGLINRTPLHKIKRESYDRVITSYVRSSSERAFSAKDLKKLLDFINELRPELKRQFLSSAVTAVSKDIDSVAKSLGDMSVDNVIDLLSTINEQMVVIPEALKNILDKFSRVYQGDFEGPTFGGARIEDDILLSAEITNLLGDADFKTFVTDSYEDEIQRILKSDAKKFNTEWIKEWESQWSDEYIEEVFNQIVQEVILSDKTDEISRDEYEVFIKIMKEQVEQFINTGRYKQVLKTFSVLESDTAKKMFPDLAAEAIEYFHSTEFISQVVNSFRIIGRESREEAFQLCRYYGEKIIPLLMYALIDEESQSVRRFILSLTTLFGDKAAAEAVKRLDDSRWFVQRNMLFILNECGSKEALRKVRPFCNHENPKV